MPMLAASSISAFTGKQKRYSVPSPFRMLAIAAAAFIRAPPRSDRESFVHRVVIEDLHSPRLVGDLAPDRQAAAATRFDHAPLPADPHHTSGEIFLAQWLTRRDLRHLLPRIELAADDHSGQT